MQLGDWVSLIALILSIFNLINAGYYHSRRLKIEEEKFRMMLEDEERLKHERPF